MIKEILSESQAHNSFLKHARRIIPSVLFSLAIGSQSVHAIQDSQILVYDSLQGMRPEPTRDPNEYFFNSREDFLNYSSSNLPLSILFQDQDGRLGLQIGYGEGWVPGAFSVIPGECAPTTENRVAAYRQLFEEFQRGEEASRDLIGIISEGAVESCDSFFNS